MSPRFTIIVPTYNRPDLLAEALDSVLAQTVDDYECIVVDDGSNTAEAVMPDDPRFTCISLEQNRGHFGARNVGVEAARGEVLCFLDDDDAYTPTRLELAERGLATADVALTFWGELGKPGPPAGRQLDGNVRDVIMDSTCPPVAVAAVRREAFRPFDDTYVASGDLEWWLRQSEVPVATVPQVGYLVRTHDGVRATNGPSKRIEASKRLLAEHAGYFDEHPRARAFREMRIGYMLKARGERAEARTHLLRSLRAHPNGAAAKGLVDTFIGR